MSRKVEITVGLFMLLVICSALFLCFRVTDPTSFASQNSYRVYAVFDNIGGLKARSPIKIGGVVIGRVNNITLEASDNDVYKPYVVMDLDSKYNKIPSSSSLSIKTSGLLGEQFIDVNFGLDQSVTFEIDSLDADSTTNAPTKNSTPAYFEDGFVIHNTKPAMVIEDLIGQFLYSSNGSSDKDKNDDKEKDNNDKDDATQNSYRVYAVFENIGSLKVNSPIKIGGVVVGHVNEIKLQAFGNDEYEPYVVMDLDAKYNKIPINSSLSIKTSTLLDEQFIDIDLGIDQSAVLALDALDSNDEDHSAIKSREPAYFEDGFVIHNTKPAMVIEDLIGQFLYSSGDSSDKNKDDKGE